MAEPRHPHIGKLYLVAAGKSLREFSEAEGWDQTHVNLVLNGRRPMSRAMSRSLAEFLGINESLLCEPTDEPALRNDDQLAVPA